MSGKKETTISKERVCKRRKKEKKKGRERRKRTKKKRKRKKGGMRGNEGKDTQRARMKKN